MLFSVFGGKKQFFSFSRHHLDVEETFFVFIRLGLVVYAGREKG